MKPMEAISEDRRVFPRYESKSTALVIRESDRKRRGIAGRVLDVSFGGFALLVPDALEQGEYVSVDLENPIQGLKVWRRARVQNVRPWQQGWFRVGCLLTNRLAPREVRALKCAADETLTEFKMHRATASARESTSSARIG